MHSVETLAWFTSLFILYSFLWAQGYGQNILGLKKHVMIVKLTLILEDIVASNLALGDDDVIDLRTFCFYLGFSPSHCIIQIKL